MLLEQSAEPVNPPPCAEPVDEVGTSRRLEPRKLMLVWRGQGPATVCEWLGWDTAAAYMYAEHMAGFREGDVVVLYAVNWQARWWGRC